MAGGENREEVCRRTYLEALLTTGLLAGTAGCNTTQNSSTTNSTAGTAAATPNQAPRIINHSATPQTNGTSLAVVLEGADDQGISMARIEYGEESIETVPEDASVTLEDELTGLGETSLDEAPGRVIYILRDGAGKETRAKALPDETAPELHTYSITPTESAGEIALQLQARDDVGLEAVQLRLDGHGPQLQENVSGQQEYNTDQNVAVSADARFQKNTLTAALEDWNGNTTESETDTYVRKYDVMEDTRLNIGTDYMVFMGSAFRCIDADVAPTVGEYGGPVHPNPISASTVNKHVDQMTGFGIGRLSPTFDGTQGDRVQLESILNATLLDQVAIQPMYTVKQYRWEPGGDVSFKDDILQPDLEFLREKILTRENVSTQDGRPVFRVWNPRTWVFDGEIRSQLLEEYGGWDALVSDIRSHLEVDGKSPYLVAGTAGVGYRDNWEYQDYGQLIAGFDAVSTWVAGPAWGEDDQATWEEVLPWVEENFEGLREFVDSRDMDLIPMVFPGFDDRANTCWGQTRYTPRSQQHFTELLALADEYRTTDRIDIATWNDWTEGSQIEPGSFKGTDYGTEYLEVVEEFQRAE